MEEYEDELDDQPLDTLDLEAIDYTTYDINQIPDDTTALKIAKYLNGIDRGVAEEAFYQQLLIHYGWEEADPTNISQGEAVEIAMDFYKFVQYMFRCEYGFKFKGNWHHVHICDILQDLFLGKLNIPRIIINIPPRYSKTQLLIYWVAWTMGHQPDSEYIWIGYSKLLSTESSSKIRDILTSAKYQRIFDVTLDSGTKAKDNFVTTKKGKVYATSTGGTLTGKGAGKLRKSFGGAIVVDDGNNTLDAFSALSRNKANDWTVNTLLSRRNNMKYTPIVVMAQRVHENDISGFLLPTKELPLGGSGEEFIHIKIPSILSREDLVRLKVPLDSDTYKYGDTGADEYPLWHYKIPLEKLRNMKENLPTLTFYGQYQQSPVVGDGKIIKASWFGIIDPPSAGQIVRKVLIIDTAQTVAKHSDYSVIMEAWVLLNGTVFINNIIRRRLEAPDLAEEVMSEYRRVKPEKIYIEYKSSGIGLVQYLKKETIPLPLEAIPRNAVDGDGDKICRANGIAPYLKAGYVSIAKDADWTTSFLSEVMSFPAGRNDDQVDTLCDLVRKEIISTSGLSVIDVASMPLKNGTYADELNSFLATGTQQKVKELTIEDILEKHDYRGKKYEEPTQSWADGLF